MERRTITIEEMYSGPADGGVDLEALMDESLHPRGPDMLFDEVERLGLRADDVVLDAGCRDGRHMVGLARRFGCRVVGVDLVQANLDRRAKVLANAEAGSVGRVRFVRGDIARLPFSDASFDLVWNRDVLIHLEDLEGALGECRRVAKRGAPMLVFQMFATPWLSEGDAERLWPAIAGVRRNTDPEVFERAAGGAGWSIESVEEIRSEWREFAEESEQGTTSRQLVRAARLLREPDRYVSAMGRLEYEAELGNALWGVYQMIGKLSARVYVLR